MLNFNNINNSNISISNISMSDGIVVCGKYVIVNGKKFEIPSHIKGNSQTIINNRIFIDGYEFKSGVFKKTLKALWYKWF